MDDNDFTLAVSIIIVNYNTKKLLADCLNSIFEQTKDISYEVIVSDNGSADGSVEMLKKDFPQIILIENNANLGFGAANNRGLAIAKGKYIFYLNSDTILLNNAVKCFFDYFENNDDGHLGGLGCNLIDNEGNHSHSYHITNSYHHIEDDISSIQRMCIAAYKVAIKYLILKKTLNTVTKSNNSEKPFIGKVQEIIGADLFLKNNKYAKFDENYFLYYEETDLELNMDNNGFSFYIIDGPKIIHLENGSQKQESKEVIDYRSLGKQNFLLSKINFYKKNKSITKFQLWKIKIYTYLFFKSPLLKNNTKEACKRLKENWNTIYGFKYENHKLNM